MLPSWLSKLRDVKGSYRHRKHRSRTQSDDDPSALAKAFSLQRANSRAKSSRSDTSADSETDAHRLSKGIDALYVLSTVKSDQSTIDALVSEENEKGYCKLARADEDFNKVAASFIQDRMDRDLDLWDREFSSMSSYGSDQDALPGKGSRMVCGSKLKGPPSREKRGSNADFVCDTELEDFRLVLNIESSCSESSSMVSCKCECEEGCSEPVELGESSSHQKGAIALSYRRRRQRSASISAVLPPDLQGVVGDSIALVKISQDPYEDFRESMYEMIMEKDLEEATDIEELLYCYLCLNAPEHHELIEEVFSDVWSAIVMKLR